MKEKHISTGLFQIFLPFSYANEDLQTVCKALNNQQFQAFTLNDHEMETSYYGSYVVSHSHLESCFPPYTNQILFYQNLEKGFLRFSKKINMESSANSQIPYQILSSDMIFCPYEIGFLTIRLEIKDQLLTQALEFLQSLFSLTPDLIPTILLHSEEFSLLQFKKLYITSLFAYSESDANEDLDRLTPISFMSNRNLFCFTCYEGKHFNFIAEQFYGYLYYFLLIQLFFNQVFTDISSQFSSIRLEKNQKEANQVLFFINSFMSNYYYVMSPSNFSSEEVYKLIRERLCIDHLYANTKDMQFTLFKYQEDAGKKRDSFLLLILTLYTVICGIFSMNLFTHDLVGHIKWSHFKSYNPFEYLAVFIVFSGMMVVGFLGTQSLYEKFQDKKMRTKWIQKSIHSANNKRFK